MTNIFTAFKEKILAGAPSEKEDHKDNGQSAYLISLGVLLWIVAESDSKFLPEEQQQIESVLREYSQITEDDMPVVLRTIEEANAMRVDIYSFTKEIKAILERDAKLRIVDHLFRVACVDHDLAGAEHETIRQIADLIGLDHHEFIDSKIKIKKEFGLDTVDS